MRGDLSSSVHTLQENAYMRLSCKPKHPCLENAYVQNADNLKKIASFCLLMNGKVLLFGRML